MVLNQVSVTHITDTSWIVTFTCSSSNLSPLSDLAFKVNMVGRSHPIRLFTIKSDAHALVVLLHIELLFVASLFEQFWPFT